MSTFGITPTTGEADQAGALNYALSNIGAGLRVNANTGIVSIPNGNPTNVYEYLYQWVQVAFADDAQGNGISFEPTNKLFYGLLNTDTLTEGTIPSLGSNYTWYDANDAGVSGGFSTDKSLYYYVEGIGRVLWVGGFIASPPVQALPAVQTVFDFYNYVDVTKITWAQVNSISIATVATIAPQSSEPINFELGTITVADAVTWDPATASTTTPYVAFYNGTAWTKLG
jgi:hypothetical protein